jgi:hypothetical protein
MQSTCGVLLVLTLLPSTVVVGQTTTPRPATSRVATLVGVGNSFSGIGVLADIKPFARGPLSFMVSVGTVGAYFGECRPEPWMRCSVSSVAGALGVRANAGHGQHQGFIELALLPVDDDVTRTSDLDRIAPLYGLGLQLGYRVAVTQGITVNALGGAGYALREGVVASRWKPLIGFGFGYAWLRR